jgi:hypothetical protein
MASEDVVTLVICCEGHVSHEIDMPAALYARLLSLAERAEEAPDAFLARLIREDEMRRRTREG